MAGVVTLSLGAPITPALIFAIILSSFASRLKGFSREGMGHDLDMFARSCASAGTPKGRRGADLFIPKSVVHFQRTTQA